MYNKYKFDLLFNKYDKYKSDIKDQIKKFKDLFKKSDEEIFYELCFCILTPQSKAILCDKAIQKLKTDKLILKGTKRQIKLNLNGVRFPNNKALYLIEARKLFIKNHCIKIKGKIKPDNVLYTRDWFADNVKGIGYKEASHFLRNIGLGKDIVILDRHILKNLVELQIIKKIPRNISRNLYLDIEKEFLKFSKITGVSLEELDLLFWADKTGFVFK